MGAYYDEIEIEDFAWDDVAQVFHYPCPCGDRFQISRQQLAAGEDVAICPSCSLVVRVVYDQLDFEDDEEEGEEGEGGSSAEDSADEAFVDALDGLAIADKA